MKQYCIDTNAILDICYRYYPNSHFPNIWEALKIAVISRQIKILVTEHIHKEMLNKITEFDMDESIFDNFLEEFQVHVIPLSDYEQELSQLQAEIINANPNMLKIKALIGKDQDLSNICVMRGKGTVITSEQGLNIDLDSLKFPKNFKIPDTCRYFNVPCENWLPLLTYIGFQA